MDKLTRDIRMQCPIPISDYPTVQLAHGGGGMLMHQLITKMFAPAFDNELLRTQHDGAVFEVPRGRMAFSTDSYVVSPLFFPGGDIGSLAVNGTVNDLSMCGARPLYLSVGMILEEGLPMETLWRVVQSMKKAADHAGVALVTGDTKVVDKGKGDGIFINTAGVGVIEHDLRIAPDSVMAGDAILVNGDLARHGITIMASREGLAFESRIDSDCAALNHVVQKLIADGLDIHCLRDLTRGGLASALVEIAEASSLHINIKQTDIPVRDDVHGACEMLGFDPLYVANEGRMAVFLPEDQADRALEIMRGDAEGKGAVKVGSVDSTDSKLVTLTSHIGANRIVDMLSGEQLPRIC
ncbi:MAG: hydrogenase expression/formation protein HypE [Verrucomicrobia bacterium]|nr:hydrogenase expression/formation protein HypE [Verrucomicrobiota bacterium]